MQYSHVHAGCNLGANATLPSCADMHLNAFPLAGLPDRSELEEDDTLEDLPELLDGLALAQRRARANAQCAMGHERRQN